MVLLESVVVYHRPRLLVLLSNAVRHIIQFVDYKVGSLPASSELLSTFLFRWQCFLEYCIANLVGVQVCTPIVISLLNLHVATNDVTSNFVCNAHVHF